MLLQQDGLKIRILLRLLPENRKSCYVEMFMDAFRHLKQ